MFGLNFRRPKPYDCGQVINEMKAISSRQREAHRCATIPNYEIADEQTIRRILLENELDGVWTRLASNISHPERKSLGQLIGRPVARAHKTMYDSDRDRFEGAFCGLHQTANAINRGMSNLASAYMNRRERLRIGIGEPPVEIPLRFSNVWGMYQDAIRLRNEVVDTISQSIKQELMKPDEFLIGQIPGVPSITWDQLVGAYRMIPLNVRVTASRILSYADDTGELYELADKLPVLCMQAYGRLPEDMRIPHYIASMFANLHHTINTLVAIKNELEAYR